MEDNIDRILEAGKKFLRENKPEQEPDYFVDHDGNFEKCPEGTYFDYKMDSLKFKKEK